MKQNSIALASNGKNIEWTRSSKGPATTGVFPEIPAETAFCEAADIPYEKVAEAYSAQVQSKLTDNITLVLPTSDIIFRTSIFPSTDKDEIAAMTTNQIENDSPLPLEEMVYSYEILSTLDESSTVLTACSPVSTVETLCTLTGATPKSVKRIDACILGRLESLAQTPAWIEPGRKILLIEEGNHIILVIADGASPRLIRTLGAFESLSEKTLAQTFRIGLIQVEIAHGNAALTRVACISTFDSLKPLASTFATEFDCPVEYISLKSLPTAATGSLQRTTNRAHLNLFPETWHTLLSEAKMRKNFRISLAIASLLWVGLVCWFYAFPAVINKHNASLNKEIATRAAAESQVNDLRNRIQIINNYSDRTFSAMDILLDVAMNLPEGITLSAFRYNGIKQQTLVEGRSQSPTIVYDFMDRLKTSKLFKKVDLSSGPTLNRSLRVNVFELTLAFKSDKNQEEN